MTANADSSYTMTCTTTDEVIVLTANRNISTPTRRDLARVDGKTHDLPFTVSRAVEYVENADHTSTVSGSADTVTAQQHLTFEPLLEAPVVTPRYGELGRSGQFEVLEPLNYHQRAAAWLVAHNAWCCGWGDTTDFEEAKKRLDAARGRLAANGYKEIAHHEPGRAPAAGDGPEVAVAEGGGGYAVFEKIVGGHKIIHRVVGPKGDATALVAGWAKTADVVMGEIEEHGFNDLSAKIGSESKVNPEIAGDPARYRIELQAPSALPHLPVDPNGKPHLPRDPRLDDPTSSNRGSFFSAGARDALSGTKTRNLCASSRRRGVGYGRLVKPASAFTHRRCASSPRLDRRPHSASGGRIGDGFDQRSVHDRVGRDHTARVCVVGLAIIEQHARVVGELAAGAMHQRIDRRGVP